MGRRAVLTFAAAGILAAISALAVGVPDAAAARSGTVHAASVKGVGRVLVDGAGHTLYVFSPDRHKVTCTGACAGVWPPLVSSAKPAAGSGVTKKTLKTMAGPHHARVVTYHGWPLFTFSGDTKAGEANGEGLSSFGGRWSAIAPSGKVVTTSSSSSSSSGSGSTSKSTGSSGSGGSGW